MGLFVDPLVINDGTANRTFNYRAQISEGDAVAGEYIEPAALAAAQSKLTVKHGTTKTGRKRHLLQRSSYETINDADGTLEPLVVNISVSRSSGHTEAQVGAAVALAKDAASEAGFVAGFIRERI